jgi:hypothetical protein
MGGREQLDPKDANREPVYDPEDAHMLIRLSKEELTAEERRAWIVSIFTKNLKNMNCPVAADMVRRYPVELTDKLYETTIDLRAGFRKEREELRGNEAELRHSRERELTYSPLFMLEYIKRSKEGRENRRKTRA